MLLDGVKLFDGSTAENLNIAVGSTLPTTDNNKGELFYLDTVGLYYYDGVAWQKINSGVVASALSQLTDVDITSILHNQTLTYDGTKWVNGFVDASNITGLSSYLRLSGGTLTGTLTLNADPIANMDAATKQYVDNKVATGSSNYLPLAGGTLTGPLYLNGTPTTALSAATKEYVDSTISGLSWKQSVRLCLNTPITLVGPFDVDGVSANPGDRVLVINQTSAADNGIYIVGAMSVAWTRATDTNTADKLASAAVFVREGTTLADTAWVCTNDNSMTLGTDAITFVQFNGVTTNAGTGLTKVGNTLSLSTSGATAGNYGSSSLIPVLTVDTYGRVTSASTASVAVGSSYYDISTFVTGKPAAGQVVFDMVFVRGASIPANLSGSLFVATSPATAGATFNIKKNGNVIGTITLAAAGYTGTFNTSGLAVSLVSGDRLSIIAPSSQDASLGDFALTISATAA